MAIFYRILGRPGHDNALYVQVDTGPSFRRFLFDCGEGCAVELTTSDVQQIDALFFSHLHIDHVAGFDAFLRHNYARPTGPVLLYGPPGATEILHHRLRGIAWNLVERCPGECVVTEIHADRRVSTRFLACEQFAAGHPAGERPFNGVVLDAPELCVEARLMNHDIPCLAWHVRRKDRTRVDAEALARLGLPPGPWIRQIKDPAVADSEEIQVGETECAAGELRRRLLFTVGGESIAYLTDFRLDEDAENALAAMLHDCTTLVCEGNYLNADRELAARSFHMTSTDAARLAARIRPRKLILIHISDRYTPGEWRQQLMEARSVFPDTCFPDHWAV